MARVLHVIETERHAGTGQGGDPHRSVRQLFDFDGTLLMEQDDWRVINDAKYSRDIYAAADKVREQLLLADNKRQFPASLREAVNAFLAVCEGH